MAKGNEIIVSPNPRGVFLEGTISGTPKPGTIMQLKAGTAPVGGRYTWEAYNPDADGDRRLIAVLLPDQLQGKTVDDAYADGDRGFLYVPAPGEELNVLAAAIAGTSDTYSIGDLMIVDKGTGKVIGTTGTPESEPFVCLENIGPLSQDTLVHVLYTGY